MQRIFRVSSGTLRYFGRSPNKTMLIVVGEVPTGGWTNPSLGAWYYVTIPDDGIQDFDFCADRPIDSIFKQTLPIVAELTTVIDIQNYWGKGKPLVGVRIHSQTNSIQILAQGIHDAGAIVAEGLPVPWPFPWARILPPGGELPYPFSFHGPDV